MKRNFSDLLKIIETYESKQPRYSPDRIPRAAQSVYEEAGNEVLKQATAIARRSHESIRENQAEFTEIPGRAERTKQRLAIANLVKPIEAHDLLKWSKQHHLLINNDEFTRQWIRDGRKGETENETYYDESSHRWIKRNNMFMHSTYLEFFHRLALHNYLFPEAPVRLEGFVVNDNELMPVFSQPHVQADRGATLAEVVKYMSRMGFKQKRGPDFYNPNTGVLVEDLHDENVLVSPDGHLYIVDPVIFLDDEGKSHRLAAYSDLSELDV